MLAQPSTEAFELILFDLSTCSNHEPSELNLSLHWSTLSCVPSQLACVWKSFSDSKFNLFFHVSYFLNVAAVVRFKQRLALSDAADALETIKSQSRSPLSGVTMQQTPKTPKQGGNPGRSGPHSTLVQVLIAEIFWNLLCAHRFDSERDERAKESDTVGGRGFKLL